jgi:glycosyltransferase involved in cell wall biosynthesis
MTVLLTVAIPAYNRPNLLLRALDHLSLQTYTAFGVVVSLDSSSPIDPSSLTSYKNTFSFFRVVVQPRRLGVIENALFLVRSCSTEYFMLHADDDIFSFCYIERLIFLLNKNQDSVSAGGVWRCCPNSSPYYDYKSSGLNSPSVFLRIASFLSFGDDSFLYAIHRTEALQKCVYRQYFWPNQHVVSGWCYPFLFQLLLQGRVIRDPSVLYINYLDTDKSYLRQASPTYLLSLLSFVIRRLNCVFFYVSLSASRSLFLSVYALFFSLLGELIFFSKLFRKRLSVR